MDFALLILVTAILRIRPTDIVPSLEAVPLYYVAIVSCLLVSLDKVASELTAIFAGKRPVATLMLGILVLIPISDAINGDLELGLNNALEYLKVFVYFVLLVGIVNSPARLRSFITWLVLIDLVPTSLAILDYYGYVDIALYHDPKHCMELMYDAASETMVPFRRLTASGMFGDPNDFCQILNTGVIFCLARLLEKRSGMIRFLWLAPITNSGFALWKTASRGGLLGAIAGIAVLFWTRYGRRRAVAVAMVAVPMLGLVLKGRMGQISATEGTGQARVQIWDNSFQALRHSLVFIGVGADRHKEVVGRATHNGFLCAFTELGVLGGALFLGAFYYSLTTLWGLVRERFTIRDPTIRYLLPFVMAALVSYTVNELTLTHPYTLVTYMMLGVATATIRLADSEGELRASRITGKLVWHIMLAAATFLIGLFIFVRLSLRY